MGLTAEQEKNMPPRQRIVVIKAEIDARLAALEGGEPSEKHLGHIKWLASRQWEVEQDIKAGL